MLSESGSLEEFMDRVRGRQFDELVVLADREATDAERKLYRRGGSDSQDPERFRRYAIQIKDFLLYLRHGVKTTSLRDLDLNGFQGSSDRYH